MAMTSIAAWIAAASIGAALFGGLVPHGTMIAEVLSIALAGVTALAVTAASAVDI